MLCVEVAVGMAKTAMIAYARVVMTSREKCADSRRWRSKYKGFHMVLLFIGIQRILNIIELQLSVRRVRGRSVTFKTWVRFPSAPPRNYE